jgi:Flp pilus assembly protein TadB
MSEPLLVRVSREGKELGGYPVPAVLSMLKEGALLPTDFYWHEGMTDWAPLAQLQASEARRILAERAQQLKQEEARKAEQLAKDKAEREEKDAQEKARAKEEEDRAVAEAMRIRLEKEKANYFICHCCRDSFKKPKDPSEDFGPAIAGLIFSGILAFIPIVGWVVGPILAIYCFCIILASQIVAPYCPSCRSSNFSRPDKIAEDR